MFLSTSSRPTLCSSFSRLGQDRYNRDQVPASDSANRIMTRGRRKDLSIPPSRALSQQRDYRARKAKYLTDLENRVRRAEADNGYLRLEVEELKRQLDRACGRPSCLATNAVNASAQLLVHLDQATSSLTRFRDAALKDKPDLPSGSPSISPTSNSILTPPTSRDASVTHAQPPSTVVHTEAGSSSSSVSASPISPLSNNIALWSTSSSSELSSMPTSTPADASVSIGSVDVLAKSPPPPHDNRCIILPPLSRRNVSISVHQPYTLPPLRLPHPRSPSLGEESLPGRSTRTYVRSHSYSQSHESSSGSRLTPYNWSELSRQSTHPRFGIPSHSEDSSEECDGEEEPLRHRVSLQRLPELTERRDADHQNDHCMHDDTRMGAFRAPPEEIWYRQRSDGSRLPADGSSNDEYE